MTRQHTLTPGLNPAASPWIKEKSVALWLARRWEAVARPAPFSLVRGGKNARRKLAASLREFAGRFREHHAKTDAQFAELGRILRELYATAEALGRIVGDQLTGMRDALGASRIGGEDGLAAAALRDVQAALGRTATDLGMLRAVTEDLRRFRAQVDGTHRIGRFVELSVLLFTIESARTVECRDVFGAFVAELRGLGQKIVAVTQAIGASAAETQAMQERESQSISASHDSLRDLAGDLERAAAVTSGEAQQLLDGSLAAFNEAGTHMAGIARHAGDAVFHLQFGDIVRQKTEHVTEALLDVADRLSEPVSDAEFRERVSAADRMLAVQIGQLELVRSEIADAADKLAGAFAHLGSDATALRATMDRCHARHDTGTTTADAVDQLKTDVARMEGLYRQGNELQVEAQRIAHRVRAASRQLVEHVEQVKAINRDIHLQALNAIIKAVALGSQGTTLSVLSMHADWLYRESNTLVKELVQTLGNILATTGNGGEENPSLAGTQTLSLRAATDRITAAYETCGDTSPRVNQLIDKQQATLVTAGAAVAAIREHLPAIEEQIRQISAIRSALTPWLEAGARRMEPDAASLRQRYTMHSERAVHAAVAERESDVTESQNAERDGASRPPAVSGAKPEPSLAATNGGSLGDNVELF